jgi:hypothetical protein
MGRKNADHLAFWVLQREHPYATDYWDGNWLETDIELSAGGVRAHVKADLRAEEFVAFRQALESAAALETREANLELMEPWLSVRVSVGPTGHLKVSGDFYDELGIGNRVEYELKTDLALADLNTMIREIRGIETRFPVIGSITDS